MDLFDVENAVREANRAIHNADRVVNSMARLCEGRLRKSGVSGVTLCALKKELQDFNMHTYRWKGE